MSTVKTILNEEKVVPLGVVNIEGNTKPRKNPADKKSKENLIALAGSWNNDDETYDIFSKVCKERAAFTL